MNSQITPANDIVINVFVPTHVAFNNIVVNVFVSNENINDDTVIADEIADEITPVAPVAALAVEEITPVIEEITPVTPVITPVTPVVTPAVAVLTVKANFTTAVFACIMKFAQERYHSHRITNLAKVNKTAYEAFIGNLEDVYFRMHFLRDNLFTMNFIMERKLYMSVKSTHLNSHHGRFASMLAGKIGNVENNRVIDAYDRGLRKNVVTDYSAKSFTNFLPHYMNLLQYCINELNKVQYDDQYRFEVRDALESGSIEAVKLFMAAKPHEVREHIKEFPQWVMYSNNVNLFKYCHELVKYSDSDIASAAIDAIYKKKIDVVKYLIENAAYKNITSKLAKSIMDCKFMPRDLFLGGPALRYADSEIMKSLAAKVY